MHSRFSARIVGSLLAIFCCVGSPTCAESFSLPPDASSWVNSAPLSMETLKGKAAVLWFFEEQ